MNRPPKKKKIHQDDLSRDPRFNPDDLKNAPDLAQQDDRNLVGVDDAFRDADVEDKVWLFWQKHGKAIIFGGGLALVFVLGFQGYQLYQENQISQMQADYLAVAMGAPEVLQSFGLSHSGQPLGAFALLRAADDRYIAGDYTEAATLYEEAIPGLTGTAFGGRAELGAAMSLIKGGQSEAGQAALERISADGSLLGAIRGEATFNLALLMLAAKDYEAANRYLNVLSTISQAEIWAQRGSLLREGVPELTRLQPDESEPGIEATPATEAIPATKS